MGKDDGCQNNRKAYLWSLLVPLIIPLVVVITVLSSSGMALADDHDVELQDVMDGNVPGLTATVNGSGGGYYGDSLRVSFSNDTTQALRIKIPIGLRLAPEDTSVQTMITAGTEIITVCSQQKWDNIAFRINGTSEAVALLPDGFIVIHSYL